MRKVSLLGAMVALIFIMSFAWRPAQKDLDFTPETPQREKTPEPASTPQTSDEVTTTQEAKQIFSTPSESHGVILGNVINATSREPVTVFNVRVDSDRVEEHPLAKLNVDDAAGYFEVSGLPLGNASLLFTAHGYAPLEKRFFVRSSTVFIADYEVELVPVAEVHGRVLDPQGSPISRARIFAGELPQVGARSYSMVARSNRQGQFVIKAVPLQTSIVSADHPDYVPGETAVELIWLSPNEADIQLIPAARLAGTVTQEGEPVRAQEVSVDGRKQWTQEDGAYEFDALLPGEYRVTLTMEQRGATRVFHRDVIAEVGKIARADFDVSAGAILEGMIHFSGLEPQSNELKAMVNVEGPEGGASNIKGKIDPDGHFSFPPLPTGLAKVSFTCRTPLGAMLRRDANVDLVEGRSEWMDVYFSKGVPFTIVVENIPERATTCELKAYDAAVDPNSPASRSEHWVWSSRGTTISGSFVVNLDSTRDIVSFLNEIGFPFVDEDGDGRTEFIVDTLEPGEYVLELRLSAYGPPPESHRLSYSSRKTITVADGQTVYIEVSEEDLSSAERPAWRSLGDAIVSIGDSGALQITRE